MLTTASATASEVACPFLRCSPLLCSKKGRCPGAKDASARRPITAVRSVRKMRGRSHAHLIEANDGRYYVVKSATNPQGTRTLANGFIGACIFRLLGISAPLPALVRLTAEFLDANPTLCFEGSDGCSLVAPGLHLGSRFPGRPESDLVLDVFPQKLLVRVGNVADFIGALIADKWLGTKGRRHAVFTKHPSNCWGVRMVGFGRTFGGVSWQFHGCVSWGLSIHHAYCGVTSWSDLEEWLHRVEALSIGTLKHIASQVPADWVRSDEERLQDLLERLMERRAEIPVLIRQLLFSDNNPFPNWTGHPLRGAAAAPSGHLFQA